MTSNNIEECSNLAVRLHTLGPGGAAGDDCQALTSSFSYSFFLLLPDRCCIRIFLLFFFFFSFFFSSFFHFGFASNDLDVLILIIIFSYIYIYIYIASCTEHCCCDSFCLLLRTEKSFPGCIPEEPPRNPHYHGSYLLRR